MKIDNKHIRSEFEQEYDMSLFTEKTFGQQINILMKEKDWDIDTFCTYTGLNETMFSRIKQPNYEPSMKVFVSLCVGLELNMYKILRLLECTELRFKKSDVHPHKEYFHILDYYSGSDIEDCNAILTALGVKERDLLGSCNNKKRKKK